MQGYSTRCCKTLILGTYGYNWTSILRTYGYNWTFSDTSEIRMTQPLVWLGLQRFLNGLAPYKTYFYWYAFCHVSCSLQMKTTITTGAKRCNILNYSITCFAQKKTTIKLLSKDTESSILNYLAPSQVLRWELPWQPTTPDETSCLNNLLSYQKP